MRIAVMGAAGRMGQELVRAVAAAPGCTLVGGTEAEGSAAIGRDLGVLAGIGPAGVMITADTASLVAQADAILDFTRPAASVAHARLAAEHAITHIIGTTGCSPQDDAAIAEAAARARIIKAGNMSLGVNLLVEMVRRISRALDEDFDIEILEMHHRNKVDAPSGTALMLGEAAAEGRALSLAERAIRVRDGHTGPRPRGDIGFATLRGGSVIGDHTVVFAGNGERVEVSHKADDRGIYARGAVKAAQWAAAKPPGLYSMVDVLGL